MTKEILKNIIPSMIATLFTGFYVIVDGLFIGQKIGDLGLAAINVAWPIAAFIQALGIATGTACGIYISYFRSKNEYDKIKVVLTNTILLLLIYTLVLGSLYFYRDHLLKLIGANEETLEMASDYIKVYIIAAIVQVFACATVPIMRNFGHYKAAAFIIFSSTLINFLGDYLLIMRFDYGLAGAAIASVISQVATLIVGIIILLKYKDLKFKLKITKKYLLGLFLKGIAPFILTFSASFLIIIYNLFCLKYGGNDAVSAYTVVAYIIYAAQYISIGISDGLQPLLTYHYGLNDGKVKGYFYRTLIILSSLLLILNIIFIFLSDSFADVFNLHNNARLYYKDSYFYFIFSFIPVGITRIYSARFYSTNLNIKADILVLIEPIITPIMLAITTSALLLDGVWVSFLAIQLFLALSAIVITKIPIKELNFSKMMEVEE